MTVFEIITISSMSILGGLVIAGISYFLSCTSKFEKYEREERDYFDEKY